MQILNKLYEWHKHWTYEIGEVWGLDDYELMWLYYFEGVATVVILQWIF